MSETTNETNNATDNPITNPTTDDPTNPPPRYHEAFVRLLSDIRAVPESDFVSINIDIQSSVVTVIGAWPKIKALRPDVVQHLPTFDIKVMDGLESNALALGYSQAAYHKATQPLPSIAALVDEATKWREVLLNDVNSLISRGLVAPAALGELKGVNGYKNIGFDLLRLAIILQEDWASISDKIGVKRDELDLAQNVADRLLTAVGEREQAPAIAAAAVRDRQAAFSLFINAYDEVRTVIGYLRRKEGDVDSIAPSLYLGRVMPKKNTPDQPPATTAAPATTNSNVASTGNAPATPSTGTGTSPSPNTPTVSAKGPFVDS